MSKRIVVVDISTVALREPPSQEAAKYGVSTAPSSPGSRFSTGITIPGYIHRQSLPLKKHLVVMQLEHCLTH